MKGSLVHEVPAVTNLWRTRYMRPHSLPSKSHSHPLFLILFRFQWNNSQFEARIIALLVGIRTEITMPKENVYLEDSHFWRVGTAGVDRNRGSLMGGSTWVPWFYSLVWRCSSKRRGVNVRGEHGVTLSWLQLRNWASELFGKNLGIIVWLLCAFCLVGIVSACAHYLEKKKKK